MRVRLMSTMGALVAGAAMAAVATLAIQGVDAAQAPGGARSVNDGVYSSSQARMGEGQFRDLCASCHTIDQFTGSALYDTWPGPLDPLFDTMRTTMPDDSPGSLAPEVYANVIAYFLKATGYPAGNEDLPSTIDALHNISLDPPGAAGAPAGGAPAAAPAAAPSTPPAAGAAMAGPSTADARFQLDLHVNDAALQAMLPPGFTLNVAAQGPAKDANLRAIFVDELTINGADGAPAGAGSNRVVFLAAPVKDAQGGNAQLVLGGISAQPAGAPGPFGNYLRASRSDMKRTITGDGPNVTESQDWNFEATSGEHVEMHITFARGTGARRPASNATYYSAKDPSMKQVVSQEQVLQILRNVTTNPPDQVSDFSFKASGGSWGALFDGSEKPLSWDNIIWMMRRPAA
jgi:mono/diheme cytochrome c family protein